LEGVPADCAALGGAGNISENALLWQLVAALRTPGADLGLLLGNARILSCSA